MEIRVLRYFLEVAREGNITHAAERLHISQPTLSKQLKELETELGKKLFVRGNYNVRLTNEGMLLRKRAEDILHGELAVALNIPVDGVKDYISNVLNGSQAS